MSVEASQRDATRAAPRRRWGWILIASAVWTFYVWITRSWIIAHQQQTAGFKTVHYTLAAISVAFGVVVGRIGLRLLRSER